MRGSIVGLSVFAALLAAFATYMISAASLSMVLTPDEIVLMHAQAMDVTIGVGAAIGAIVCVAAVGVISALSGRRP